ncbi:Uncharacterized protein TCM_028025 [Theobroma cacao]|uniref:Uncharacterized protein n=1 Tax=Theobroma cacao TaxID=3641 RepID=A0A061G968_THECC|nr:Uncharacterized protein TCM_028025 [Theobroma cacao]
MERVNMSENGSRYGIVSPLERFRERESPVMDLRVSLNLRHNQLGKKKERGLLEGNEGQRRKEAGREIGRETKELQARLKENMLKKEENSFEDGATLREMLKAVSKRRKEKGKGKVEDPDGTDMLKQNNRVEESADEIENRALTIDMTGKLHIKRLNKCPNSNSVMGGTSKRRERNIMIENSIRPWSYYENKRDKGEETMIPVKNRGDRRAMWERLKLDMESFDGKLCIGGNFNTVCYEEERIGRGDIERLAVSFNDFINVLGLMDLPLEGGKFTWCNYKEQAAFSCLDRLEEIKKGVAEYFKKFYEQQNILRVKNIHSKWPREYGTILSTFIKPSVGAALKKAKKARTEIEWEKVMEGTMKFNVDGAANIVETAMAMGIRWKGAFRMLLCGSGSMG